MDFKKSKAIYKNNYIQIEAYRNLTHGLGEWESPLPHIDKVLLLQFHKEKKEVVPRYVEEKPHLFGLFVSALNVLKFKKGLIKI